MKSGAPLPPGVTGPNQAALEQGFANLEQHIANVRAHGVPVVVAVNAFKDDSTDELNWVCERALEGVRRQLRCRPIGPTVDGEPRSWPGRSSRSLRKVRNSVLSMR